SRSTDTMAQNRLRGGARCKENSAQTVAVRIKCPQPTRRRGGTALLYMIIEHFKNQDPAPVYRRFRDRGRLAPEGLQYVSSWVDEKLERCFQLMETENPT